MFLIQTLVYLHSNMFMALYPSVISKQQYTNLIILIKVKAEQN